MSNGASEKREDERACQNVREDLIECLILTECFKNGGSFQACLKDKSATPDCQGLRLAYFECKKAQVDARKRFRGSPTR